MKNMTLIITVKVFPSSGRNAWALDATGNLKCYLKSAPEKGKANKELITFLADSLGVAKSNIDILAGETSRIKKVKIDQKFSLHEVLRLLGLQRVDQHAIF